MLFRKTHGNFCFKKCFGVSLFRLASGNVGRGNDGKRFSLFAGQFAQKEENWEVSFSIKALAGSPCPALPGPAGSLLIQKLPRWFLQRCAAEVREQWEWDPSHGLQEPKLKTKGQYSTAVVWRVTPGTSYPSGTGMTM